MRDGVPWLAPFAPRPHRPHVFFFSVRFRFFPFVFVFITWSPGRFLVSLARCRVLGARARSGNPARDAVGSEMESHGACPGFRPGSVWVSGRCCFQESGPVGSLAGSVFVVGAERFARGGAFYAFAQKGQCPRTRFNGYRICVWLDVKI